MINKDTYLTEGLVHKIYKFRNSIYKVPKESFEDFNNQEHFEIEKISHSILRSGGLPAVKVEEIFKKGDLLESKYVLKEKYINGRVIDNPNLSKSQRREIIKAVLSANKIKISGFGNLDSSGKGKYKEWKEFIFSSLSSFTSQLDKSKFKKVTKYIEYLIQKEKNLPELSEGFFLFLDVNSNNFIFNEKKNEIVGIIDIDHPISGDPLYEYAALKWHQPNSYKMLISEFRKVKKWELELLKIYYIHFGISTLLFENIHGLEISTSLRKLNEEEI